MTDAAEGRPCELCVLQLSLSSSVSICRNRSPGVLKDVHSSSLDVSCSRIQYDTCSSLPTCEDHPVVSPCVKLKD